MSKPTTFEEAVEYLDQHAKSPDELYFSIRYWGFGEHFTTWTKNRGFIDFDIDEGTIITWPTMKNIIISSAQFLYHSRNP